MTALLELLLTALLGGHISVPLHVQDASGIVDVTLSYDPTNGHIDVIHNRQYGPDLRNK